MVFCWGWKFFETKGLDSFQENDVGRQRYDVIVAGANRRCSMRIGVREDRHFNVARVRISLHGIAIDKFLVTMTNDDSHKFELFIRDAHLYFKFVVE